MRRFLLVLCTLVLALALVWLGGFVWYANELPREAPDEGTRTDAIVVLTGGSDRLDVGLDLLAAGLAKKLFISGVGVGASREDLLRLSRRAPELFECCVVLGKEAIDTFGNAIETARWMRSEGFASLRVVTAGYHMPRSLVELRRALPDAVLVANPVFPAHVKLDEWWRWQGTTRLLAAEFNKYLFSLFRAGIAG